MNKFIYNAKLNEAIPNYISEESNIQIFSAANSSQNLIDYFILLDDAFMKQELPECYILPDEVSYLILHIFENKFSHPQLRIVGPRSQTKTINRKNRSKTFIAVLKTGALKVLLNQPQYLYKDFSFPVEDFFDDDVLDLREKSAQLISINKINEAIKLFEGFFSLKFYNKIFKNENLIRTFKSHPELNTVSKVSDHFGFSERYLRKIINEITGLSPKEFLKVQRLKNTLKYLSRQKNFDWIDLAIANGYYDQSHLINEFNELIGLTPVKFVEYYE